MNNELIKVDSILERSLDVRIEADATEYYATRCVACGPDRSYYHDVHILQTESACYPTYWKENFRHELKKHQMAMSTLVFEYSSDCTTERFNELVSKMRMEKSFDLKLPTEVFHSISFHLTSNHEYFIFVLPKC